MLAHNQITNLPKLEWYQQSMILSCLAQFDENIKCVLKKHLPYYFANKSIIHNCNYWGSISYNVIISHADNLDLVFALQNHGIEELYGFIHFLNNATVFSSKQLFHTREMSYCQGLKNYHGTYDLFIYSTCKHGAIKDKVCQICLDNWRPQNYGNYPELKDYFQIVD